MTRKLFKIFLILLFIFISYVIYINFNTIYNYVEDKVQLYVTNEIKIPQTTSEYKKEYDFIEYKNTSNFIPNNKTDIINIYYTILNNGWEDFSFYCPNTYENCMNDVIELANDDELLSSINNYVSPFNSYINYNTMITNNNEIYIQIKRLYNNEDINVINEKIDEIFNELNITEGTTESIKKLHNYIIDITKYDSNYTEGDFTSSSYKATGVLVDGKSVCSGYTDTLAIMLDRLNIKNFKVSNSKHVWNAVYIDNEWLHIDATWDDDEINKTNRLNFFLITTDKLNELDKNEHTFNSNKYLEFN